MKSIQKLFLLLFLLCCFTSQVCLAQFEINGTPFIQNYDRKTYKDGSVIWTVIQDKQGKIYAATRDNLLQYDGVSWKKLKTSTAGGVRDIVLDEKGNLYIADDSDVGYMSADKNGKLTYHSLSTLLPKEHQDLTFITRVDYFENEVYFASEDVYYKFNPADSSFVVDKQKGENKLNLFQFENRLLLNKSDKGLFEKIDGEWMKKLDTGYLTSDNIKGFFPHRENQLLLFGAETGAFIYDDEKDSVYQFQTPANDWIAKNYLYTATYFKDKEQNYYYVLGSFDDGILIINVNGEVVQHINKKTGLISNDIAKVYVDSQNAIWAATYKGLAKISFELPFTFFDFNHNVITRVNQTYKNEDSTIYIAANNGLFFLKNNNFELVNGFPHTQCWEIVPVTTSKFVVASGNRGFFYVADKKVIQNVNGDWATMAIGRSKKDSSIFYNGKYQGFEVLRYQQSQDRFVRLGEVKAMEEVITRKVIEDTFGFVWTQNPTKGFYQIHITDFSKKNIENAKVILQTKGLEEIANCRMIEENGKIIFQSAGKEYNFNYEKQIFEPYSKSDFILTQNLFIDSQNNHWDLSNKIIYPNGNKNKSDSTTLLAIDGQIQTILEDKINQKVVYWIATSEGLALYQPQLSYGKPSEFSTFIREIKLSNSDSIIFYGEGNPNEILEKNSSFKYENNSFVFSYAAPAYYLEKETLFRFRLKGYENEWSEWTNQTQKEYTNLDKGDYVFEVQAKNFLNQISTPDSFSFSVKPPFYKTAFAYFVYLLLAILIVYGIVRAYTLRLKRSKERLEAIVKERTQEVVQKNTVLETQKEEITIQSESLRQVNEELNITVEMVNQQKNELQEQNRNINSSITYAKRIQEAILPFNKRIENSLNKQGKNDFFVLYKPRDVVSGDFYFFEEVDNKIIFIVADCTGHGVPGAFMSMIGTQLLNSIVKVNNVTDPAQILEELHNGIFEALKQDDSKNVDGMDAVVITLHRQTDDSFSHIEYAGAMNPLYFVQEDNKEELQVLKADKRSIGGEQKRKKIVFTNQMLSLYDENQNFIPTTFYLCSDGLQDQFGGQKGRKLMLKGLRNLLLEASQKPMSKQKDFLENKFEEWKGRERQIDDILVFGLRIG
ncbi:SpoIIE family protein phosphatase [Bernardetia sp.]|uniref:SpoIIE family protein phosphatase n=1 Tax=Bernardetia sp. TaxID=1937974 RepID=UPI0025B82199|nr:SpoIIE family protein phosphatase [Bernardetia sp.]